MRRIPKTANKPFLESTCALLFFKKYEQGFTLLLQSTSYCFLKGGNSLREILDSEILIHLSLKESQVNSTTRSNKKETRTAVQVNVSTECESKYKIMKRMTI